MKSLILIPSYLWKNTLKRWLENPVSPISKILVPLLLGLLATLVLVFFAEAENQLSKKLAAGNSFDVFITEQIVAFDNRITAEVTLAEEQMWLKAYKPQTLMMVRQIFVEAKWRNYSKPIPVIIYSDAFPELQIYREDTDAPTVWLLTKYADDLLDREVVTLSGKEVTAIPRTLPENLPNTIKEDTIIAIPIELAKPYLREGFSIHIHARFKNIQEVKDFVSQARAYYASEKRNIQLFSALEVLEGLEQLRQAQTYFRIGIVASCGIILALILGTIAWLEYRQEAYLLALLRSFGTPRTLLIIHCFLENCILVSIGIIASFYAWKPVYSLVVAEAKDLTLSPVTEIALNPADAQIILLAGILGVSLAMIPVAFGLRKQPGLILQ